MPWDTDLWTDQKVAASHVGSHARLLAGPGTGKTLTLARRCVFLVQERGISPGAILVLTFTRAAARELRDRLAKKLGAEQKTLPRVSTLHAFALRQLLRNSATIGSLPKPLRISDDWEERRVIYEDLKRMLGLNRVDEVEKKFTLLSADWETLNADAAGWEESHPDPQFLSAWREHRQIHGYTLRSELVYQLKRALEQNPNFKLEEGFKYGLVDEYQDLNACDLAVLKAISNRGIEIFCAGDDDQSIYGFRHAHPEGIRRFLEDYEPSTPLALQYCHRCDRNILDLGLFVARLDHRRLDKPLEPLPSAGRGEVAVLWFDNQDQEAKAIAEVCHHLIRTGQHKPAGILILLRNDTSGAFSNPLRDALGRRNVPVAVPTESPLDTKEGRELLSTLRLSIDPQDHLAWRTLLMVRRNGLGEKAVGAVYDLAAQKAVTFAQALGSVKAHPQLVPRFGERLSQECQAIETLVQSVKEAVQGKEAVEAMRTAAELVLPSGEDRDPILNYVAALFIGFQPSTLGEAILALTISMGEMEQEVDPDRVNILTMHKAKGLTAGVVFVAAAEDEHIPGVNEGAREGDERRLFYVSLTRAKHKLFITHCRQRTGQQMHKGRARGRPTRTRTRFLQDAPNTFRSQKGIEYLAKLRAK